VKTLQVQFEVSERQACDVLGQPRCLERYASHSRDDEAALIKAKLVLVRKRPRLGYRRIGRLFGRNSWQVSDTRVYRLWSREGVKVPKKKRKKRRMGGSENGC